MPHKLNWSIQVLALHRNAILIIVRICRIFLNIISNKSFFISIQTIYFFQNVLVSLFLTIRCYKASNKYWHSQALLLLKHFKFYRFLCFIQIWISLQKHKISLGNGFDSIQTKKNNIVSIQNLSFSYLYSSSWSV